MANPFYGGMNYGVRNPYLSVPPIGTRGINMNPQPIMQPSIQNIQQNLQSMIPQSNIIWIDDVSQISTFPTGSGWQQWFGLKNEQVLFVRETDMNGITQPIRKVRYEIETENTQSAPAQPQQPTENSPAPVGREEFDKLTESVNLLTEKLSDLLK